MDLKTPLSEQDIRRLRAGDIIYVSGTLVTARDGAHKRVLSNCGDIPVDMRGLVLYHCGPVAKKVGDEWVILSAGPTTSYRLEDMEADFIK
ncbi:MAG TPA: L(+)-tartrate dehydratase subunit beta, partial [Thermoplasmatales archaeon]|nr:L(+)-tartrate dehydratase subunit beta [Thermoplasmatales archaeon]